MKEKMFKYFTANNTNKYIDVLDDFVERYNNTRHSSMKMTPVEASKKENEVRVYRNLYPDLTRRPTHGPCRRFRGDQNDEDTITFLRKVLIQCNCDYRQCTAQELSFQWHRRSPRQRFV